jgi:hypothetical protein
VETPHPHRLPVAGGIRHPLQFGHSDTLSTFEATAATVLLDAGVRPIPRPTHNYGDRSHGDSLQPVHGVQGLGAEPGSCRGFVRMCPGSYQCIS